MKESPEGLTGLIDVNAEIGPRVPSGRSTSLNDLMAVQERFGIAFSLTRHTIALIADRDGGNAALAGDIRSAGTTDRFGAVVVASTLHLPRLGEALGRAVADGAQAVWVEGREPWSSPSEANQRLLATAASFDLPLFVPHREWGDASAIGRLTQDLDLPVILVEARYPDFADVFASLERYPNLHVESSSLGSFQAIETTVDVAGHERVLFGSGTPVRTPRSPLNALLAAEIGPKAREAIARGNAARIFGIRTAGRQGPPLDVPERLFDVHGHFFPAPWEVPRRDEAGPPLDVLRRFGIRRHVASSIPAIMGDLEAGNAATVASCASSPDQLGYLVANPLDVELAGDHIRRWGRSPGIAGIKVHSEGSGVPTASPRMAELFDALAGFGLPVKIHNHGEGWEDALLSIARAHPDLPIIVAHSGHHRPQPSVGPIVNGSVNVHIELASSKADLEDARELVSMVDEERILFGADAPLLNPAFILGLYQELGLADDVLGRIYWDNAERVFGAV